MSGATVSSLPHEFFVTGSPVSVNRYGTAAYRDWRSDVHTESVNGGSWSGCLVSGTCSILVRYFRRCDRQKDVDNILKAILDGLDGKVGGQTKQTIRVLLDDKHVERVVCQRTKIDFSTKINARRLRPQEYAAVLAALSNQAAVFVSVTDAPDHQRSVTR
ncbi:MAG: hypothetical protein O9313_18760 [Acetobacteraceae bacterium]|nr:hypothetical protein [Acetobacteraceae bacterium]